LKYRLLNGALPPEGVGSLSSTAAFRLKPMDYGEPGL